MRRTKLELAKELKKIDVNNSTRVKILDVASETKQTNYLAKYNELLEKKIDGVITPEETELMKHLKSIWIQIENLVKKGNSLESDIDNMSLKEIKAVEV